MTRVKKMIKIHIRLNSLITQNKQIKSVKKKINQQETTKEKKINTQNKRKSIKKQIEKKRSERNARRRTAETKGLIVGLIRCSEENFPIGGQNVLI